MDKIEQLYNLYLQKGLITNATTLDMFRAANDDQQSSLYKLGMERNLFQTTDEGTFKSAWGGATTGMPKELKKKEESATMGLPSGVSSLASQEPFEHDFSKIKIEEEKGAPGVLQPKDVDFASMMKKREERPTFIQEQVNTITPELIDQIEEVVVPQMNYQFGPMGFKFEESGATGDWMVATSPDGVKKEFSLDPAFGIGAKGTAEELKKWIRDNAPIDGLKELEKQYVAGNKKYASEDEYKKATSQMNSELEDFKLSADTYFYELSSVDKQLTEIDKNPNDPNNAQKRQELLSKKAELNNRRDSLAKRQEELSLKAKEYQSSVGKYVMMQSEQGQDWGALLNSLLQGAGQMGATMVVNIGADIGGALTEFKPYQEKANTILLARDLGIEAPLDLLEKLPEGMSQKYKIKDDKAWDEWYNSLSPGTKDALEEKFKDKVKKEAKYGKDGEMGALEAARTGYKFYLGSATTEEYKEKRSEESFPMMAFTGVAQSLPAMIGGGGIPGWIQRGAQMYAQATDNIYQEMEKNPEFKNVSENEKILIAAPIGIAEASLEAIGLRNVIANKGLMNKIILGAMGKAGATTTAKTFGELVKNEVESMGGRALLTAAGAALAEAETGAAQQVSEYAFKEIYNMRKGKDMFETPDFLSSEYFAQVGKAAAAEALGGLVLGIPSTVSAAYSQKGYKGMSDVMFEGFERFSKDENLQSAFIMDLKNKVSRGQMSTSQAKEALNNYRNSVGLLRSLPDGLTLEQKKEAMNLLKEKRDLEQQIQGKEDALVKRQKDRIAEITSELEALPSKPSPAAAPSPVSGNRIQILTEEEEKRRSALEESINNAMSTAPEGLNPVAVSIDGSLVAFEDAQKELATLNEKKNAIQESSTEGVLPRQQGETAEAGGQRGEVGQGVQGQEATQAGTQEKVSVLSSPETITVALEQLPSGERTNLTFTQEDGTETPVMGNEKMLADMYSAATQVAEEERTPAQRSAIDAVEVSLKTLLDQEAAAGQTQLEDSGAEISALEDNKVYTFEAPSMDQVPEQFRGTAVSVPATEATVRKKLFGIIPYGKSETVTIGQPIVRYQATGAEAKSAYAQVAATNPEMRPRVATNKMSIAKNVAKSIASIFPNLKITNHANAQDMRAFAEKNFGGGVSNQVLGEEGGMIIYDENNKPIAIMINDEVSDATTLPHEAWHGILIRAFGQNEALFTEFKDSIKKRLIDNGFKEIADQLDEFSQTEDYQQSNSQAEEWLVQFGGLLTASGITSDNLTPKAKTLLQQIKQVFNDIAVKITGSPMFLEDATPTDVLDFMVAISDRMRRGESIADFFRQEQEQVEEKPKEGFVLKNKSKGFYEYTYNGINTTIEYSKDLGGWLYFYETENGTTQGGDDVFRNLSQAKSALSQFLDERSAKGKGARTSLQKQGDSGAFNEVKKIATRYNVNNQGFAPKQVDERAMDKELSKLGYGARRARPTGDGYGGGVYIVDGRGRFFNPFKTSKQGRATSGMFREDPSTIEGYDRMVGEISGIIERSRQRGASDQRILDNVINYMQKSAVYQKATDVQREIMVRDIRSKFGLKEKPAPSIARLFGSLKNVKKITMAEKDLLKKQIRDAARGAKDAKKAWMTISQELTKAIKELAGPGGITTKQVASVIRRFSKVNVFNQESIDRFVDYMVNVFEDAEYADKIEKARSLAPRARKNVDTKIGAASQIAPDLKRLFSINPSLIPIDLLDRYISLVESFGQRQTVLSIPDSQLVASEVSEILDAIDQEVSVAEEMAERFDNYQDKEYDDDGNLLYSDTVDKMLEEGLISAKEAEIMKKYKSIISPRAEKPQMTEQEIQDEKDRIISGILQFAIDPDKLSVKEEKDMAQSLSKLLTRSLLNSLTIPQLNNVAKLIENINNGYMPHYGQLTLERLNAINNAKTLEESVRSAKPIALSKMYANLKSKFTRKEATFEMIRRNPLFFIDQLFGDFKTKRIFESLFGQLASKHSAFDSDMNAVNKKLDIAHDAVAKSHGYNANKTIMSSFKMMTYMLQNEYESNPESTQVNPAIKYLQKTITFLKEQATKTSTLEAEMLEEIIKKYGSTGEINKDALYRSFNPAEKEALRVIREVNDGLTEKATHTAGVIRGKRIDPLVNYVHHFAKSMFGPDDKASASQLANQYNGSLTPSSRAMNLIERQKKPTPLNFDVFASAQRGAKFTLLDYHMTEAIRTARKTIGELRLLTEGDKATRKEKEIVNALSATVDEVISNVLTNNFVSDSFADQVINFISKSGYRAYLAGIPRFASELTSNLGFAMLVDPKSFTEGVKYRSLLRSPVAISIMNNVKSKVTTRLFHGDTLSGRFIDTTILSQSSGVKSGKPMNDISNVANMIYNMSLKKYKNFVELTADALISTPDKIVMRPMWFGAFATEFKRQTGEEVDFDKIAENDEAYMSDNSEAIKNATDFADERSVSTGASDNPFMGILKGTLKPDQSVFTKAFNNFNSFMTRFTIYEYVTARQGIHAAMGDGTITRKQGAAMLAAVVTRMTLYSMLTAVLTNSMLSLFGDEDEEDEKTIMQRLGQGLASTFSGLILGRDFGNAVKGLINYGVEEVNQEYLDALREGKYDPYKDAISFTYIPTGDKKTNISETISKLTGSYGPALSTLALTGEKLFEEPKKTKEAIQRQEDVKNVRIPLQILGSLGMVPMYKDIKNVVNKIIYEDLRKAEKNSENKKKIEEEMLHGYKNKTEMKRYDPDLYDRVYGEDSPGYEAEKAKKAIESEKRKLEREMKDDYYNYVPKKKSKGAFGSEAFGVEKSKKEGFGSEQFGKKQKKGGFGSEGFGK